MATTERIGEGLTFEKVWAALMEDRELQKENAKEHDRLMKDLAERQKETDKQIKETDKQIKETDKQIKETDKQIKETDKQIKETGKQMKETGKQMKETDKRIGDLSKRFGESVEYMVVPNLVKKFKKLGFVFEKAHQNTKITDREDRVIAEIDAFMENGDKAMAVESKVKPSVEDVNDHVKRMEKLREYADRHNDTRKYLGAIAGVVVSKSVKTYALSRGFYVLEPSGDTFTITEPTGEYHPHEW
jgi:predicted  nucleic acid-binding Zn-ribbon protein